ncbi:MAG TPA: FecR domain-containing protein [Polyangia bacterium]|nr:FecR domain-containing protein [Polyangia bacterium]
MTGDSRSAEASRFRVGELLGAPDEVFRPLTSEREAAFERALGRSRESLLPRLALGTLAICAAVLVGWWAIRGADKPALPFTASTSLGSDDDPHLPERNFTADGAREGTLQFADGSVVTLTPGARARVLAQGKDPQRSQVMVTDGRVRFAVRHGSQTHWQVSAGPFRVHVTGTSFTVSWSPRGARFLLVLTEGSVRVEGAGAGAGLPLRAGQTLTADVQTGEIHVARNDEQPETTAPAAETAPAQPAPPPQLAQPAPPPPARRLPTQIDETAARSVELSLLLASPPLTTTPGPHQEEPDPAATWAALLTAGDYRAIIAAAETMGIDRCLRRCSAAAQMSLADAARYRGRRELARQLLHTLVAGPLQAAEIARAQYLLGQLAESEGAHRTAIEAYRRCEAADRHGPYGALALGRTVNLLATLRDAPAARQAAARYLQRFAGGPFAEQAQRLIDGRP